MEALHVVDTFPLDLIWQAVGTTYTVHTLYSLLSILHMATSATCGPLTVRTVGRRALNTLYSLLSILHMATSATCGPLTVRTVGRRALNTRGNKAYEHKERQLTVSSSLRLYTGSLQLYSGGK